MANRYFLKVKEVTQQTAEAVTIHFWHPLNEVVRYQPGQFLTFILNVNGQKVRRSYSMSSSPHTDASPAVTIKRIPGGVVSNYLCENVKASDVIETLEPMGKFVASTDPQNRRQLIMIGAGSGITPLMSMMKSVLHVESKSQIWLLYGNRTTSSILFRDEIIRLESQYRDRFRVSYVLSQPETSWDGMQGRLNQSNVLKLLEVMPVNELRQADYFLCGPDGMMEETRKALQLLNVPERQIYTESFNTTPPEAHGEVIEEENMEDNSAGQEVTILYEGSEYKVAVEPHQTILEAALELDIDLPYSCQAGMCTACMGRCTSGKVMLDEEDGLSEAEIAAGYVLTCVAHPLTKDVVIEIE